MIKLPDQNWRLNNLYKIVDKKGRLRPFRPNHVQQIINSDLSNRKQILKYRQGGVTTNEVIKMLDFTLHTPNAVACILSHEQDSIQKIFEIVRRAYDNCPSDFKPPTDKGGGSRYEMRFPNRGSKIYCDLESRGDTIRWLHVSERAFADSDRIKATMQAVPPDGIITWESTPNGIGNDFHKEWVDSNSLFNKLFFPWFTHGDEYSYPVTQPLTLTDEENEFKVKAKVKYGVDITDGQILFRRAKKQDLKQMYYQEYPEDDVTCFLSSGQAAMDLMIVQALLNALPESQNKDLEIYHTHQKDNHYVIGADVAEGVRSDYSTISVFNATKKEQVAQYRSNTIRPKAFAHMIKNVAEAYHSPRIGYPLVAVEVNNHGHAVLLELDENIKYPNLYRYKPDYVGWKTDSITRPLMIDTFIDAVEDKIVKINSRRTLEECLTLIDNDGKIEAADGSHDDCIVADAIAIQMILEMSSVSIYDNLNKRILI